MDRITAVERPTNTGYEPPRLEVLITLAVGKLLPGIWRAYVDRLPLKGDECVLELGPSAGNLTYHLAERLSRGKGKVTCVDISKVWTEVAQKRLKKFHNINYFVGDIDGLDIPDGSHDAALVSFVLHDIPLEQRNGVMKHLIDKLKPGGKVFIREPLRFISQEEIRSIMQRYGLVESSGSVAEIKSQGMVFEGIYSR
jgi:ubiquinone/menaquinone biosynthesis C-methylase UbiE